MKLPDTARFSTVCIHAGQEPDPSTGAIITPIYQTSTYVQEAVGQHKGYEYARTQNPTRFALEQNLAAIEGGKAAYAFASGMAAISAITTMLAVRRPRRRDRQHLRRHLPALRARCCGATAVVQLRRHSQLDLIAARDPPETKMLFVETPTNPVMRLTDLRARRRAARMRAACGSSSTTRSRARSVQRPIEFGADLVVHSTTKYLNGHSDSVGGVVVAVRDDDVEWLTFIQNAAGAILEPVRFLARAARHEDAARCGWRSTTSTARRSPSILASHPKVTQVLLSGTAEPSAARAGEAADAWLRRNDHVRRGDARGRASRAATASG